MDEHSDLMKLNTISEDSLDQIYPVVDGGPVEERYVFLIWLSNVKTRLHQLPATLEDAVPLGEGRRGI